jgi:L-alanine-DL-glutamate epimerase-like enolase superfamily enzyme
VEWRIKQLRLELKYIWKISRNASEFKENFIIEFEHNGFVGQGEVAPNVRYNENPTIILKAFENFKSSVNIPIEELKELMQFLDVHNLPNALRFGIESAFIHWYCKANEISLHEFLGVEKPSKIATCYTLPIMEAEDVVTFYETYELDRFQHLKIKVNETQALDMLEALASVSNKPVMIDANESWKDVEALIQFLPKLQKYPVLFVEQPLPAHLKEEYVYLKKHSPFLLMADESVLDQPDMSALEKQFHGINMKLMKAGGYLNGLRILQEARRRKMKTMVGCMVETTLGIHSAWNLCAGVDYADLDGCLILANEPFELLKESNGYITESVQGSPTH